MGRIRKQNRKPCFFRHHEKVKPRFSCCAGWSVFKNWRFPYGSSTHCGWVATGLYVFDLRASQTAVPIVAGCSSQKNWEPRLQLSYNLICVIMSHRNQLLACGSKNFCGSTSTNGRVCTEHQQRTHSFPCCRPRRPWSHDEQAHVIASPCCYPAICAQMKCTETRRVETNCTK